MAAAAAGGLDVQVGRLSSFAAGDAETVFRGVRAAFEAAEAHGPTVMIVTLASGVPDDGSIAEIQRSACV